MGRELRRLRTWLGRVLRDIRRQQPAGDQPLDSLLTLCERLHRQRPTDSHKLDSLHEPDVVCISKGKAHQRDEFGQKIALATSNRRNWIAGVELCPGNPYDGHTLAATLQTIMRTTGLDVQSAFIDKGYRGHGNQGATTIHIVGE